MFRDPHPSKTSGFSLIEIIIIVLVIAIVSVTAFYTYNKATQTFGFLGRSTEILSMIRSARSYALTNKQVAVPRPGNITEMVLPKKYKIRIERYRIQLYYGDGANEWMARKYYPAREYEFLVCRTNGADCDIAKDEGKAISLPVEISYEIGSGNTTITTQGHNFDGSIAVLFQKTNTTDNAFKKYFIIFKISGLAEQYKYPLLPWQ